VASAQTLRSQSLFVGGFIMKTIKLSAVMASMLAAGSLLLTVPAVSNASSPGQGWDAFNSGASNEGVGEPIPMASKAYRGTALEVAPSLDSDAFRTGYQ
jgi:hypothetical protein